MKPESKLQIFERHFGKVVLFAIFAVFVFTQAGDFISYLNIYGVEELASSSDSWAAKNKRQQAIWDANPGAENAMLKCVKLAGVSEQYQATKLESPVYTRKEVFDTCMRDMGFGRALNMLNKSSK